MKNNSAMKSNERMKLIQKAILTGVGVAISKDTVRIAATTLYNDIHKEIRKLLSSLEQQGELKAKETKKLILELQKKSEAEKLKIYKELRKNTKPFLRAAENVLFTPIKLIQERLGNKTSTHKTKTSVKKKKAFKKRASKKK